MSKDARHDRERWFYCYSDWVSTYGWMGLILSAGVGAGLWIAAPGDWLWFPTLAALPLCVPLILHRQEICVEPETGRLELQEGTWPWIVRREFGRGELRWVYLSGGGLSLTSWITLGIEDRTGRRYKLCTEGQEQIEQLEAEAETLARVLGVVAYPTPAFHDARRRIYSGRRERLRAGVTMVSVGAALGLLVMLLLTGRVHWGGEPYSSAMAMLFSFGSLALLAVGAPLVFENGVDRKMARLITDRRRRSV